jgi:hypothetical protein
LDPADSKVNLSNFVMLKLLGQGGYGKARKRVSDLIGQGVPSAKERH